ncbi:uncharacterized protein EV420DRAFT_369487 [Desarmillaria tabescens]|uniref:Uncharacterized protein n=1 Tax=Armillaria tabescens TaxID=1929756 RepID=A0AA39N5H4_ARMTA|nr:uncharacterized protein EV420DRAFT_369487 [Desarmillaria tabescens]KAK0458657.1 hypothetical protein EV420DRAFT_369487 [Desarmillaria tabescens]
MMPLKPLTKSFRLCLIPMLNVICAISIRQISILFSGYFPLLTPFEGIGSNTKTLIYQQRRATSFTASSQVLRLLDNR